MGTEFVHLHVHSQYSFLASTVRLGELPARVAALGMRAVALTDSANMFGAIRHYKQCRAKGLQPLLGCEVNLRRSASDDETDHLVLLARTPEGYRNLVELVSLGHLASASERAPSVTIDALAERAAGLIVLTGCLGGVAAQRVLEQGEAAGEQLVASLRERLEPESLYVEVQQHGLREQRVLNELLQRIAGRLGLKTVATNDVHYLGPDDAEAQIYLECVGQQRRYADVRKWHHGAFEMYLKSAAQMEQAFAGHPEALAATVEIAERCSGLTLELGRPSLPRFPVPEGQTTGGYFAALAESGLEQRLAEARARGERPDEGAYRARLAHELGVILRMDYAGYFLIVADFIREARARGISVGPGRGSGAGSLVAYSLGITALDPIPHALLFERFLNPERVSMPDFDIDFCMARRDEVLAYVAEKYGTASVGQIATFQNLKARSVIKDVARAMGISAVEAQQVAKLVPELGQGKTATIGEALEGEPRLRALVREDPRIAECVRQAQKLEGLTRHAGTHAAGVVIGDGPLESHVPCFENNGVRVTQYDKDDVEAAGLVKFDFLGLKTLTVLDIAERLVNARPDRVGRPLVLASLPLDDADTYTLICTGDTKGVFQLESSGMQGLLRRLECDRFDDIVAAVALYRPGPLGTGMIDDYVAGKQGRAVPSLHPLIDPVLAPTYGVPVYQEQVMQIAQHLSGYTLGAADSLRRVMGKKKAEEMAKQKQVFVDGAVSRGVTAAQAEDIFNKIEGFAAYGFNKSHSAAYALITYQTAYLKAHYPAEFFTALLSADADKNDKVVRTIAEARAWGVPVLPPDLNASAHDFSVHYANPDGKGPRRGPGNLRDPYGPQIRFGLGAVRGVGAAAVEAFFEARQAEGPFRDLFDLAVRVDARKLNRAVLEALVQAGAFDATLEPIGISRARAFASLERALERSRAAARDRERGQTTLFGIFEAVTAQSGAPARLDDYLPAEPWTPMELLRREKSALGFYVSGHPVSRYADALAGLGATRTKDAARLQSRASAEQRSERGLFVPAKVAATVESLQVKRFADRTKANFEIEDVDGRLAAQARSELIPMLEQLAASSEPALLLGKLHFPPAARSESGSEAVVDAEPTLLVNEIVALDEAVLLAARTVRLRVAAERLTRPELERLRALFDAHPGASGMELVLGLGLGAEVLLSLDGRRVAASPPLLDGLRADFGAGSLEFDWRAAAPPREAPRARPQR